jgi:16S rRNA (uracil1498-N3)-methyltransferase
MQRHRFYASPESFEGTTVTLSSSESHHLTHVLRLKAGDEVFVFDGRGFEYRCTVTHCDGKHSRLETSAALTNHVESPLKVTLAQALAKGEKFDFIIQKATELGAASIVPLVTDRSEVRLKGERSSRRRERWERVSLEAVKQCGRRTLVKITDPIGLRQFLDTSFWRADRLTQPAGKQNTPIVFAESGGKPAVEELDAAVSKREVTALVGPEGGWSENEMALFRERQYRVVTLGPRILRTETAAVVALAVLQHALGDM